MRYPNILFLLLAFLSYETSVFGQSCTFGAPIINQTFGQGNSTENWYGPLATYAPGASTLTTFIGPPGPTIGYLTSNQSGLVKTPATPGNSLSMYWRPHADHTGDANGLMFLIDGIATPTVFFEQKMDNLCPNTLLRLSIWVLNTNLPSANGQKPNMILKIIDANGNNLGSQGTGDVMPDGQWHQYLLDFTNGSSATVTLQLINNTPTNGGNDFALDDITVQACGPLITTKFNNNESTLNMCEGNTQNFNLDASIASEYNNPVYQWQENNGSGWIDIAGKTTKQVAIDFLNRNAGIYQYRLITATDGNLDKPFCRAISDAITVTVFAKPKPIATNTGPTCVGDNVHFLISEGVTFEWRKPNGDIFSTDKSPILSNVSLADAGIYTASATSNGCTEISTTTLVVSEPITLTTNIDSETICASGSVQLLASGGIKYSWYPTNGLSAYNIANPIATPKETTTYTVTASNDGCSSFADITITVLKPNSANAGIDRTIVSGDAITLNGKADGDNITYSWFPTDFLDDPTKLNPIATPLNDINYTLTVTNSDNCDSVTDDVFIKVYPKIIIPNTFTPNGDGINDKWDIKAGESFPNTKLKITNRFGQLVYQSNGLFKPWDGRFNGKDLPPAVYYYVINFGGDLKPYSGWITLIR